MKRAAERIHRDWHRTGQDFTDGKTLAWEYLRETPVGDRVDLLEVIEIASGSIHRHRIYLGVGGRPPYPMSA